jgi:hypothetical protein
MRRIVVLVSAAAAVSVATSAQAVAALNVCVGGPTTAITVPTKAGKCGSPKVLTVLATESDVTTVQNEVAALQATLSKVSYHPSGLNGLPTLEISGANVQIDNGAGQTFNTNNGLGNLFLGYNEGPGSQTGSHNLVLGFNQSFTSYGGVVAGAHNTVSGADAGAFGYGNTAGPSSNPFVAGAFSTSAGDSSVVFGQGNSADGTVASILGGHNNTAHGLFTTILGGAGTTLTGNCTTFPATAATC